MYPAGVTPLVLPDLVLRWPLLPLLSIFWGMELLARLSAIVFFEMTPETTYPSSCFLVTLFFVEAGWRTRLPKSGLPLRV